MFGLTARSAGFSPIEAIAFSAFLTDLTAIFAAALACFASVTPKSRSGGFVW